MSLRRVGPEADRLRIIARAVPLTQARPHGHATFPSRPVEEVPLRAQPPHAV